MVLLAVGGREIQVDDDHLKRLSSAGTGTPILRSCWAATTADYLPVLVLELPGGLLITPAGGEAEVASAALPWSGIAFVEPVEADWTMLIGLSDGTAIRLLFASIAQLRRVFEVIGAARDADLVATRSRAIPKATMAETVLAGPPMAETRLSATAMAETAIAAAVLAARPVVGCADRQHRPAHAQPRRSRGAHRPSSALDRIERRLASVETLLADLATGTHGPGG